MMDDPISKPVKLLVGHMNPDMDVIGAMWLFIRFGGKVFDGTLMYFVPAGEQIDAKTLKAKEISPDEVVHVDTGLGVFDHHQPNNQEHDSASLRVYQYLVSKQQDLQEDEALKRVVKFVNETDHFGSYWWPEPTDDRHLFMLEEILAGLRSGRHFNDRELVEFGQVCLDGVYTSMKIRVSAEKDLEALSQEFDSPWGTALAIENRNDEVMKLAQKRGYDVVVRKDAEQGHVRIKAAPKKHIQLRQVYERLIEIDREGEWYYHPSGHMLLNSSKKDPTFKPTKLTLEQVVEVVKRSK